MLTRCEAHGRMVGDIKPVGDKVFEMRFFFGSGYRVYYTQIGYATVFCLLVVISPLKTKISKELSNLLMTCIRRNDDERCNL